MTLARGGRRAEMRDRSRRHVLVALSALLLALAVAGCQPRNQSRAEPQPGAPPSPVPAAAPSPAGEPAPAPSPAPAPASSAEAALRDTLESGGPYTLAAAARNNNVQLTVTELRLASSIGNAAAPAGHRYVVLTTVWKNLVPPKTIERPKSGGPVGTVSGETEQVSAETAYVVPDLARHLYLAVGANPDQYVVELSPATRELPEPLPHPRLTVARYNEEVRGTVAFAVPTGPLRSLTLQFYDFNNGHISVPLSKAPLTGDAIVPPGRVRNQLLEAAAYGTAFAAQAGTSQAPAGSRYLLVDFGAASVVEGNIAQIDLGQYAFLIEDGVYLYRPAGELTGVPYQLHGLTNFLPALARRGTIVFMVPEATGRLELLLAASRMDPLSFVLTPNVDARAQPRPLRTINDGEVAEVAINSATAVDRAGIIAAPAGWRFVMVDITALNKDARQGVVLQPVQFTLTDGQTTYAQSSATSKLLHGLAEERVIPAGKHGRFEIAFEVPAGATGLRLKYQGFTKIEEVALP